MVNCRQCVIDKFVCGCVCVFECNKFETIPMLNTDMNLNEHTQFRNGMLCHCFRSDSISQHQSLCAARDPTKIEILWS